MRSFCMPKYNTGLDSVVANELHCTKSFYFCKYIATADFVGKLKLFAITVLIIV